MRWQLETLYPGIFHLRFANAYDCAMHFLRYQENYESPEWRDKVFTLVEFMDWYAKDQCKGWSNKGTAQREKFEMFSYPSDWGGFNVPSYVFDRLDYDTIPDINMYDEFMQSVVGLIRSTGAEKFYLIGTTDGPESADYLDHEVSHGFYYTNESYRQAMEMLLEAADPTVVTRIEDCLLGNGYCEEVIVDEQIAYLATGLPTELEKWKPGLKAQPPFEELLQATKKEQE
jgi:hypothetical protein